MRKNAKPDHFEDHAVNTEEPPKVEYADHQPGLDAEQLDATKFPKNKPVKDAWTGMPKKRK